MTEAAAPNFFFERSSLRAFALARIIQLRHVERTHWQPRATTRIPDRTLSVMPVKGR